MLIKTALGKLIRPPLSIANLVLVRMSSTTPKIMPGEVPAGYKAHTESSTTILVPDSNTAFLNPVQQYNRDLSISVIRAWNEMRKEEAVAKQELKKKKQAKGKGKKDVAVAEDQPEAGPSKPLRKITILEALSATGLRSIRYAKEIPDVRTVLANDISHSACEAMRMNVDYNNAGPSVEPVLEGVAASEPAAELSPEEQAMNAENGVQEEGGEPSRRRPGCDGFVTVNENDACMLMYEHRHPAKRVEVVDLDPYGTAAPFIDGAVQCVTDGGLLAVTCTDLAVLAGHQYPEKCYSNYGGASVNTSWSHEAALRLVLGSLSNAAARYGRYITPLVSFSIDFYVRVFVRVDSKATEVKKLASRMGVVYCCHFCHSYHTQPFGRTVEKVAPNGNVNVSFKTAPGPPVNGSLCEECGSTLHLGGPMWLAPIHDVDFVNWTLKSIEGCEKDYGTWPRIHGMLTLAANELENPFYLTANKLFGTIHASSAPTTKVLSALLNGGYKISRSHAAPGSIKTNAPCSFMYDIVREHVKENPVRMDKIPEKSPSRYALLKPMTHQIDFTPHPDVKNYERSDKVVFYQTNPQANWGPASRAKNIPAAASGAKGDKRKSEDVDVVAESSKKVKVDDGGEEEGMNA